MPPFLEDSHPWVLSSQGWGVGAMVGAADGIVVGASVGVLVGMDVDGSHSLLLLHLLL
jgi:hypothetical protein